MEATKPKELELIKAFRDISQEEWQKARERAEAFKLQGREDAEAFWKRKLGLIHKKLELEAVQIVSKTKLPEDDEWLNRWSERQRKQ